MEKKDWNRVKEAFGDALEMTAEEREGFLRKKFEGELNLESEVLKMLAADIDDGFFEDSSRKVLDGFEQREMPEKIGKYLVIREIGRGGMGAVYEAVWATDNFSQRVAIKVIKRGMDTDAILSRFRHEQKILSTLEHPNIARFLDGGVTDNDLPFYAMEYVEGQFIDEFCRTNKLSSKECIRLFRKVCDAVHYAHQNLVVHRDLKPANILVTNDGTPKLLDFGIGKIVTPDSELEQGTATRFGMMTPEYASPEQVRRERIGTSSDTYSLGIILFELLTGKKPYVLKTGSDIELNEAILQQDPVRPSTIRHKETGERALDVKDSDIDNILLKALRKNPADRYGSVLEFSEDLRRQLVGLPVSARPLTLSYRFSKFAKRNKAAVFAGGLVFLSLTTGLGFASYQAYQAQVSRLKAEARFAEVRELANNVVFKYHDAIADLPGSTNVRKMLVTDALKYLDNLSRDSGGNKELQKELANAYLKMGDVQGKMYAANTGDAAGALKSYQKAVLLGEQAVASSPDDVEAKEILIKAYDSLAFQGLRVGLNRESSKLTVEKAIKLFEQVIAIEPQNKKRTIQLIDLYVRLGDVDVGGDSSSNQPFYGQDFKIRLGHHLKALPIAESFYKTGIESPENIQTLARVYQRIGADYLWIGDVELANGNTANASQTYAKGLEYHTKMFELTSKLIKANSDDPIANRFHTSALSSLVRSLTATEQYKEALKKGTENLERAQAIAAKDIGNKEADIQISNALSDLSLVYEKMNKIPDAIKYLRNAIVIENKILKNDKSNREVQERIKLHQSVINRLLDQK